jgi:xanthine dehydrogenase accessory factor
MMEAVSMRIAVVRGVGDVGSAVAHRLHGAGYAVVIHDVPRPTTTRRGMAFADAAFDGVASLDGVEAHRAADLGAVSAILARRSIAVYLGPLAPMLDALKPAVLVDARLRKRVVPEDQRGLAALVIGCGPGFAVGATCDLAVETSWERLGVVLRDGRPLALGGEPRALGGHARERYVYAPRDGVFRTARAIGDGVTAGEVVALIDGAVLVAPLTGLLRGLTRDGVPVTAGTKVIEVDPRGRAGEVAGIGERPRRIADGVMEAILTR